jgi:hypothetical protein
MWRVCKEAGRPWPRLSDDDVIDYMVMEAVCLRVAREDEKAKKAAEKQAEIEQFKKQRRSQGDPVGNLEYEVL